MASPSSVQASCAGDKIVDCSAHGDCRTNDFAKICIEDTDPGKCRVFCEDAKGNPDPSRCTLGETCVPGWADEAPEGAHSTGGGMYHYCRPAEFVMDLNLLDSCIQYFVEGTPVDLSSSNTCSIEQNLSQMLDVDQNGQFDIDDVDLCIIKFLELYATESCSCVSHEEDLLYSQLHSGEQCQVDSDCSSGAKCRGGECSQECVSDQQCQTPSCSSDDDCGKGYTCKNQICTCDDPPCQQKQVCDSHYGFCRQSCIDGGDCPTGQICGSDYLCREDCNKTGCGGTESNNLQCNTKTGFCQCKTPTEECTDKHVFCSVNEDCGDGLFCNQELHFCQRECGYIVNRTATSEADQVLDRPCTGSLKTCQYSLGRCETVDISEATCQVDTDCPNSSYCFLGQCQPNCYSSIQCPDSNWYCSMANTCLPIPPEVEGDVDLFDPFEHSILFAQRTIPLTTLQDEYQIPVLIMNLRTRKQVFNQPNVVFGYRLEVTYAMKQDAVCFGNFDKLTPEQQKECVIAEDEEFITMENPFGTIYGEGNPSMNIRLNYGAVDKLSPGFYKATLRAIFNNGNTDEVTVTFQKNSPNGEYIGTLTVYKGGAENTLGNTNLVIRLNVDTAAEKIEWDDLLDQENIFEEREYRDMTEGFPVTGYIDGNQTLMFNQPQAHSKLSNKIALKGIYAAHLGRMRLIGVIDLPETNCQSEDGGCSSTDKTQLQVKNVFGRKIRRLIEFIGPFDYRNGRFHGGYRETISGLAPTNRDLTLEGEFSLRQSEQDDSEIQIEDPPISWNDKLLPKDEAVGFPSQKQIENIVKQDIQTDCGHWGSLGPALKYASKETYDNYLREIGRGGDPIFNEMIFFEGEVGRALAELENNTEDYLTLAEYLKGTILFCPEDENGQDSTDSSETCIRRNELRCGLALQRKALLFERSDTPTNSCASDADCKDSPFGSVCLSAGVCGCHPEPDAEGNYGEEADPSVVSGDIHCEGDRVSGSLCDQEADTPRCGFCSNTMDCAVGYFCNGENLCEPVNTGWVALEGLSHASADFESGFTLFCPEVSLAGSDCLLSPSPEDEDGNPALFTLQEHNRFYKELVQTLSYEAGNDLSDAFYTMYKAFQGDDLDADSALEYKEMKLYTALKRYDELREQFYSAPATVVAFQWPMRWFASVGNSWLQYMHTATNDRLQTISDLIDLKRRVAQDVDEADYVFVHHLMQEEYLGQILLFALQEQWQRDLFRYTGPSKEVLEKGQQLLFKVDERRNPLGFHPNRVYFENSDVNLLNWQNYRNRLETEMAKAEESVGAAIANLKDSLRDRDNLEAALMGARHDYEATLDNLCGSPEELPDECMLYHGFCNPDKFDCAEDLKVDTTFVCAEKGDDRYWEDCKSTIKQVVDETGQAITDANSNACRSDSRLFFVGMEDEDTSSSTINEGNYYIRTNNTDRPCMRGQMGALMQESALLDTQREQVYDQLLALFDQIGRNEAHYKSIRKLYDKYTGEYWGWSEGIAAARMAIYSLEAGKEIQEQMDSGITCLMIAGVAFGTDCPGKIAVAVKRSVVASVVVAAKTALQETINQFSTAMGAAELDLQKDAALKGIAQNTQELLAQAQNYVHQYELLIQQKYTTELKIADTQFIVSQTAARYNEVVNSIVDRLIGRESGSVLVRNRLVSESNARFQEVLSEAYKMAQAFAYRYNFGAETESLNNKVYTLQTIKDVRDFIEELDTYEKHYCGARGFDCDNKNNQKVLALSLRDALAPNLQDIVDPKTGKVLTKGEQFHNEIVSSLRRVKRRRATGVYEQIELPIRIWLSKGAGVPGLDQYMINPEECNHVIVGHRNGGVASAGTIAVNVIGTRLKKDIEYELWRNATDYVRSCNEKVSEYEYKVNTYTAGWAPQHAFGKLDNPDSFLIHSPAFVACKNNWRLNDPNLRNNEDSCFNYFARGRSLGTLDTRLVIPFVNGTQSWILGEGLTDDEKPIIEDIVVYFRYNSQPIYSDGL